MVDRRRHVNLHLQHRRRRERFDPPFVPELRERRRGDVVHAAAVYLDDVRDAIRIGHADPAPPHRRHSSQPITSFVFSSPRPCAKVADVSDYLGASADISADGLYRYVLTRRLSAGNRVVLFVGVNPSTADERRDDRTVTRCAGFARSWGFDVLVMGNLYGFRCTYPSELTRARDPIGRRNRVTLRRLVKDADTVICAWGRCWLNAEAGELAGWVSGQAHSRCLIVNQDGSPRHPLYVPKTARPRPLHPGQAGYLSL